MDDRLVGISNLAFLTCRPICKNTDNEVGTGVGADGVGVACGDGMIRIDESRSGCGEGVRTDDGEVERSDMEPLAPRWERLDGPSSNDLDKLASGSGGIGGILARRIGL